MTGARLFHSIGINYYEMGKYKSAFDNLEKALEIRLKEVSKNHPEVGASYYALGLCYSKTNKLKIAMYYPHLYTKLW